MRTVSRRAQLVALVMVAIAVCGIAWLWPQWITPPTPAPIPWELRSVGRLDGEQSQPKQLVDESSNRVDAAASGGPALFLLTVHGKDGPLEGAGVYLLNHLPRVVNMRPHALTDATGKASLRREDLSRFKVVFVSRLGYLGQQVPAAIVDGSHARIRLEAGHEAGVRCVDLAGNALPGITLAISQFGLSSNRALNSPAGAPGPNPSTAIVCARTDESGVAKFAGLSPGPYFTLVMSPVYHEIGATPAGPLTVPGNRQMVLAKAYACAIEFVDDEVVLSSFDPVGISPSESARVLQEMNGALKARFPTAEVYLGLPARDQADITVNVFLRRHGWRRMQVPFVPVEELISPTRVELGAATCVDTTGEVLINLMMPCGRVVKDIEVFLCGGAKNQRPQIKQAITGVPTRLPEGSYSVAIGNPLVNRFVDRGLKVVVRPGELSVLQAMTNASLQPCRLTVTAGSEVARDAVLRLTWGMGRQHIDVDAGSAFWCPVNTPMQWSINTDGYPEWSDTRVVPAQDGVAQIDIDLLKGG